MCRLMISLLLIALSSPVLAHGADELGHHWEMPAYRTEMLTQILVMAGASVAVAAWLLVRDRMRRKRVGR
jgi:hypothetical protein